MPKKLNIRYLLALLLISLVISFESSNQYPYEEQSRKVTDEELQGYLGSICIERGRHIGLTAIGHCPQCGGMTPCCNMQLCDGCAATRGVCPFCLKKLNWTINTEPAKEIPLLLAIVARVNNLAARRAAISALIQIKAAGTLEIMMKYAKYKMLHMELAAAVGEFKDERYISFLKRVLHSAGDSYFGDENQDRETQYYLSNARQVAATSLAKIGNRDATNILLASARKGKLWERYYALAALGDCDDKRAKETLEFCLIEFFAENQDWKWIPGRDLIGATLRSLAKVGDKKSALLVLDYIRNPGCDFLYEDLRRCLASIGKPAVPELIAASKEDFDRKLFDWSRLILIEALADIGDTTAIPFFMEMIDRIYPDEYVERDFKEKALEGLGKLKAFQALKKIDYELINGREESTRYAAAQALGQIGGYESFTILEAKLKQADGAWVTNTCLASLNSIAFNEIKTGQVKLKAARLTMEKAGYDVAFQLVYQDMLDGQTWPIDFFFEILNHVPMQQHLYSVIALLDIKNKKVFNKTLSFLKSVTKLSVEIKYADPEERKTEVKQKFLNWYNEHYQELLFAPLETTIFQSTMKTGSLQREIV